MERITRKPFQGVTNIIRFNWHFYAISSGIAAMLCVALFFASGVAATITGVVLVLLFFGVLVSLAVSFYIYDLSDLYKLNWLNEVNIGAGTNLVNITAGFDETSALLKEKYPASPLVVFDFYDPAKHTEVSIERARKAYAVYPGTKSISTSHIPLEKQSQDYIFAILSAHEIRNRQERIRFLKGLGESLKQNGKLIVVEHLRNLPNFMAYTIGFFHFFSKREWKYSFDRSGFTIVKEIRITIFIVAFILQKNGTTS
jgi:hypothetical protein